MKSSHTVQRPTSEEVALAARDWFVDRAHHAIAERGRCLVSLSSGTMPRRLYQLLAELEPGIIDWPNIHLFLSDERDIPQDHSDSNYQLVKQALLDRLGDKQPVVHGISTGCKPADEAAREYELTMRKFTRGGPFTFDIVLLGLGDDAHVASLFPKTIALTASDRWVAANYVKKLASTRVTLTAPILNEARNVAFLVCGASKQWAIDRVLGPNRNPTLYPAQLIEPAGELWWFMDETIRINMGAT